MEEVQMRIRRTLLIFSIALIIGGVSAAAEEEMEETEGTSEAGTETESPQDTSVWKDYQIMIDNEIYTFPMKYRTFAAYGWNCDAAEDSMMEPDHYERYVFTRGGQTCEAYLLNLSVSTVSLKDCIVAGIVIEEHDWGDLDCTIALAGGLIRGVSSADDILAAYGEPTGKYEGSLYTQYTYREDYNREVELEVYNFSGILENFRIEIFDEPAGYETGTLYAEIPQNVLDYSKPEALSESMTACEMELDGQVYALPVPVRILLEDGWTLIAGESDSEIPAQYYGWVTLQKGEFTMTQIVRNGADDAQPPENCWLQTLEIGTDAEDLEARLPGGLTVGMSESRLLTQFRKNEIVYELTEDGEKHIYTYNSMGLGHSCTVTAEGGHVTQIACENSLE